MCQLPTNMLALIAGNVVERKGGAGEIQSPHPGGGETQRRRHFRKRTCEEKPKTKKRTKIFVGETTTPEKLRRLKPFGT